MIASAWPQNGAWERTRPRDEEELNALQQMLDLGDAHLEPLPIPSTQFTHRLVIHLPGGGFWLVSIREEN